MLEKESGIKSFGGVSSLNCPKCGSEMEMPAIILIMKWTHNGWEPIKLDERAFCKCGHESKLEGE
jgi:hypothetical protein